MEMLRNLTRSILDFRQTASEAYSSAAIFLTRLASRPDNHVVPGRPSNATETVSHALNLAVGDPLCHVGAGSWGKGTKPGRLTPTSVRPNFRSLYLP
jgi:hypothetical protein